MAPALVVVELELVGSIEAEAELEPAEAALEWHDTGKDLDAAAERLAALPGIVAGSPEVPVDRTVEADRHQADQFAAVEGVAAAVAGYAGRTSVDMFHLRGQVELGSCPPDIVHPEVLRDRPAALAHLAAVDRLYPGHMQKARRDRHCIQVDRTQQDSNHIAEAGVVLPHCGVV